MDTHTECHAIKDPELESKLVVHSSKRTIQDCLYNLHVGMSCAILCQIVSHHFVSKSSLHRLAVLLWRIFLPYNYIIWPPSGDTRGPSAVFEAVDMHCAIQFHFVVTLLTTSMTFGLLLTHISVLMSLYVMLSIHLSIFVWAAASFFCADFNTKDTVTPDRMIA